MKLAPVRASAKRGQDSLDLRQQPLYLRLFLKPGEVDADGISFVTGAHPQFIGCNRSNFGYLQQRRDCRANRVDSRKSRGCAFSWYEIFGLQFYSGAGRKLQLEMRQPIVPATQALPTAFGTWFGIQSFNRMQFLRCRLRSE